MTVQDRTTLGEPVYARLTDVDGNTYGLLFGLIPDLGAPEQIALSFPGRPARSLSLDDARKLYDGLGAWLYEVRG
jgi:hypothetical protein